MNSFMYPPSSNYRTQIALDNNTLSFVKRKRKLHSILTYLLTILCIGQSRAWLNDGMA